MFSIAEKMDQDFIQCCQNNELERVTHCLTHGVDVNTLSEDGCWSGLTVAAWKNYSDLLEVFLSHPDIKINLTVDAGGVEADWAGYQWTALMFALYSGNSDIVSRLARLSELDLNYEDHLGNTVAHRAALWQQCQPDCVRALANSGRVNWNKKNQWGKTPLYLALDRGHSGFVEIIVSLDHIDYNVQTNHGVTLAQIAVRQSWQQNDVKSVETLARQERCDCWNIRDTVTQDTPASEAMKIGAGKILEILSRCPRVDMSCVVHLAVEKKNLSYLKTLAAEKAFHGWNSPDEDGVTPIMKAFRQSGQKEIFYLMISCPRVDLNLKDVEGVTLAQEAVSQGNLRAIKALAENTRFVGWNVPDVLLELTPVMRTVMDGKLEILKILVKCPRVDLNLRVGSMWVNVGHIAISYGDLQCVETLALEERCACWQVPDKLGRTPVQEAIEGGKVDILRILARCPRVDFSYRDIRDNRGQTLAELAIRTRNLSLLETLAAEARFDCWNLPEDCLGLTPVMSVLEETRNAKEMFEILTRCPRVDLNMADKRGNTVALLAVASGHVECVESLLAVQERCNSWNVPDMDDNTPLMTAVIDGNLEIFKILARDPRVDLNRRDSLGKTVTEVVIARGSVEWVEILAREDRCQLNDPNEAGDTPILHALRMDEPGIVELLAADPRVDLCYRDNKGRNVAQRAIWIVNERCVEILSAQERQDCWTAVDEAGVTPAMMAVKYENLRFLEILAAQERFLHWNFADNLGETPVITAVNSGNIDMVRILVRCPRVDLDVADGAGRTLEMIAR